jgi:hypothetical protein
MCCALTTFNAVAAEYAADNKALTASTESKNIFDLLPPPYLVGDGKQVMWQMQPNEFAVGLFIGLVLALYSVYMLSRTRPAANALHIGRGASFSRYGYARALLLNGFVWLYVLLVTSLAGLAYGGFFNLVRDQVAGTLPTLVSLGPAGASTGVSLAVAFIARQLAQRFSWLKEEGGLDLEEIIQNLEEQFSSAGNTHWLFTLTWSGLEETRQVKITELAYQHSVGLIRLAVRNFCESAVDRGRLTATEVSPMLNDLDNLKYGEDERQRFASRRLAIQISNRFILLEELGQVIQDYDRRQEDRRQQQDQAAPDEDRRKNADQRVDGALVTATA